MKKKRGKKKRKLQSNDIFPVYCKEFYTRGAKKNSSLTRKYGIFKMIILRYVDFDSGN
jgi:hypothetical protein